MIEYIIIFLCAYFISGHFAKQCAFHVVTFADRPTAIIFAIQTFTVVAQVALASIIGRISWLWIYKSVHTGLYYDLLQKLYNGSSGTAFYCRPDSKSGFQKNIQIDIIFFKSWFI